MTAEERAKQLRRHLSEFPDEGTVLVEALIENAIREAEAAMKERILQTLEIELGRREFDVLLKRVKNNIDGIYNAVRALE